MEADDLTDYATQFRYPDAAVKDDPTLKDAQRALMTARKVFEKMTSLIPFNPSLK